MTEDMFFLILFSAVIGLGVYIFVNDKAHLDLSNLNISSEYKICEVPWNETESKFIIKYKDKTESFWFTLQDEYTGILEIIRSEIYFDTYNEAEIEIQRLKRMTQKAPQKIMCNNR